MSNVEKLDDDEYDMHLSSLTVGEFFQRVETEGRLNELRLCGKKCSLHIWSEGKELNREERMEEFINNNALISVKQYRIKSAIKPYFNKGAVALQIYNLIVSGTILALIGIIGLIGNLLIIFVYSQPEYKLNSTIIYLKALAISDLFMTCTAMFLFVLEAWRHHGPISLAFAYGHGAPFFFPLASTFQTTSVYFCVGAAIDLFINVALKGSLSSTYCTVKRAQKFVLITSILAIFYNIPHFFELRAIKCLEEREGINEISLQICPTEFRMNHIYYSVYYTYMYTVFMAIGPLVLLIILNVGIVLNAIKRPREPDSDIISLVLVVCLFIFCNFTALLVNFLELTFAEQLKYLIVYLVDLSNLLVVINCTANFFVYLIFGQSFRKTLIKIFFNKNKSITKGNNKLLINEENVKRKNKLISFNEEYVENIAENV